MKLYGYGPTRAARCLWLLRELELPFEYVVVDLSQGQHRQPEFLAINPYGRVPVFEEGSLRIRESVAICLYLADRHADKGLIPAPGSPNRAVHDQHLLFTVAELDAPLWRQRLHRMMYPDARRIPAEQHNARLDFQAAAQLIQGELGAGPFLLGEPFCVADIVLAHTLFWAGWTGLLDGFDGLQAYLERCVARPACPSFLRG